MINEQRKVCILGSHSPCAYYFTPCYSTIKTPGDELAGPGMLSEKSGKFRWYPLAKFLYLPIYILKTSQVSIH